MRKKNIHRVVIGVIIIAIVFYFYTYTDFYARREINKNLDASGIDVNMNTKELLALELGEYVIQEEKNWREYNFINIKTNVNVSRSEDKITAVYMMQTNDKLYGIEIGVTKFNEATKILKNEGFFCPFSEDQSYLVKGRQSIRIGYNKDFTVSYFDLRIEFNMPRVYYIFAECIEPSKDILYYI